MKIGIGSDHAGFEIKKFLKENLKKEGYEVIDFGIEIKKVVDYPDYAYKVAENVSNGTIERGILICGTGIGMSIVANKYPEVRASLCNSIYLAKLAREHNNANILTLGGRIVAKELAWEITKVFLETPFLKGRHLRRIKKIKKIEEKLYGNIKSF